MPLAIADLLLTPLELIGRIVAWVAQPRKHRLRYFGVFAPNLPLRELGEPHVGERAGPP